MEKHGGGDAAGHAVGILLQRVEELEATAAEAAAMSAEELESLSAQLSGSSGRKPGTTWTTCGCSRRPRFKGVPHIRAFYEAFIEPNVENFEKWANFVGHKHRGSDFRAFFAATAGCRDEPPNPARGAAQPGGAAAAAQRDDGVAGGSDSDSSSDSDVNPSLAARGASQPYAAAYGTSSILTRARFSLHKRIYPDEC